MATGTQYYYTVKAVYSNAVTGVPTFSSPSAESQGVAHQPYLSRVAFAKDWTRSGDSVQGTVSLSAAVATDTTVTLRGENGLQAPAQVVIPANALSTSFFGVAQSASEPTLGRVVASVGDRSCVSDVTLLPATGFAAPDVEAEAGANCVLLRWKALAPESLGGTVRGYRVYRRTPGGQSQLLSGATYGTTGEYLDLTGNAGTSYEYSVVLVDDADSALATSAWKPAAFPSGTGLAWSEAPALQSGTVRCSAGTDQASPPGALFVNGFRYRGAFAKSPYSTVNAATLSAAADAIDLPNASVSFALVHYGPTEIRATPAASVLVDSGAKRRVLDDYLPETAAVSRISVVDALPSAGIPLWTITVKNEAGSVVRTYSGIGKTADVAWDGLTAGGAAAPLATYSVSASFSDGAAYSWPTPLIKAPREFEGIFIVGKTEIDTQAVVNEYVSHIRARMEIRKQNFPSYRYVVIPTIATTGNLGTKMKEAIRYSFGHTLQDFYFYGHAGPKSFDVGGIMFYASPLVVKGRTRVFDIDSPLENLTVNYALDGRIPNSVFLDGCNTASTDDWLYGWNVPYDPENSCFVGMRGLSGILTYSNNFGNSKSLWYDFSSRYWTNISLGQYVSQALSNAIRDARGNSSGYDPNTPGLVQRYGDAQLPRY